MAWLSELERRLLMLVRRRQFDRDLEEEMRLHLQLRAEAQEATGIAPDEARHAAQRQFGNTTVLKEVSREMWGWDWFDHFVQDVRYGLRMLRRNPGFTAVSVLTLGLGIGANSAMFSLVNGILLNPLPYSQPDRLVSVWQLGAPPGILEALRRQGRTMELAAFTPASGFNLTGETPVRADGSTVSANLFSLLGVRTELGRTFRPGEDQPGQDHVVMLSHALWQSRFGGAAGIIGRSIEIDGVNREIVGVMPSNFYLPSATTQLWLPMHLDPTNVGGYWGVWRFLIIGRLKPGVSVVQAGAELKVLLPGIVKMFPWRMPDQWGQENAVISWQHQMVGDIQSKLFILLGAVGLILLIACANVASLILARAGARGREVAVRAALGASRWRIARQLLTESLLLGIAGGTVGLLFAYTGLGGLKALLPPDTPRLAAVGIDGHVLGFTAAIAVLTGLAFGLLPALRASQFELERSLRANTARTGIGRGRRRLSSSLVVGEVALAMMLVVAAGLLIRTLWELAHIHTGFDTSHLLTARVTPNDSLCDKDSSRCVDFYRQVLDRLRALPGVQDAGAVDDVPVGGGGYNTALAVKDHPLPPGDNPFEVWEFAITPGYLHTMNIPLLEGRTFTEAENGGAPVVLVSASMARRFWPGQDPLGKQVKPSWMKEWRTVVGVVGDVREYSLAPKWAAEFVGDIYFPYQQGVVSSPVAMTLVVRTKANPLGIARDLRALVAAVNPDVPVSAIRTMDGVLSASISTPRSTMCLFTAFAFLALALGAIGIYGVLSFSVAERTHEIGIRMALGALRSEILRAVLGEGIILASMGVAIGLAGSIVLTRLLAGFLYGVDPRDPRTFATVPLLLVGVALFASYIPARRATKVDPMVALRYE